MNKKWFLVTITLLIALTLWSSSATSAEKRLADFTHHQQLVQESAFNGLNWREVGPYFCGGRIIDIKAWPGKPFTFVIAAASGGLWKTDNNATTWTSLFDHESSITIGNFDISQKNPDLIWVGSGESNSSRSSYAGTGVFKSIDAGRSWQNMGLGDSHHISRVIIDPDNDDLVYVAAVGRLYTQNEERGIFRTSDGGKTWQKILFIDADTGVIDLVMEPGNSKVLYAATWQRDRKAWHFTASGPGSGIYKSEDGGQKWRKLAGGFPQNEHVGRIGLAVSHRDPQVLYAFLDNQEPRQSESAAGDVKKGANQNLFETNIKGGEVYRSDDGGESWNRTHEAYLEGLVFTYGYYFGEIRVSPDDTDTIYVLGVPLLKSVDGGKTFKDISTQGGIYGVNGVHADMQSLWIDPLHPDRLILGNDGGLNISYDRGETWQKINNMPLAQCYSVNYDFETPYNVYTGLQDNGVNLGSSTFEYNDLDRPWRMILGGDGAFVVPHPHNSTVVYAAFQFGSIFRIDRKNDQHESIQPKSADKSESYRFNWLTPFMLSRHNPSILYLGANKMLMSYDEGKNWLEISPDLTDKKNIDGNVPYATITALDESPLSPEVLYAGSDDGNVWVSRNRGAQWTSISAGLPKKWVTRIVASAYKPGRVYISLTGYREDDFNSYVFLSEDYGQNWLTLKANLPDEAVNVLREDTEKENMLYLGTDLGIYISLNQGESWHSLKCNLPTNAVYDIAVHPRDKELIIGTHGRGVFILPLDQIRMLDEKAYSSGLTLFDPASVKLTRSRRQRQQPLKLDVFMARSGEMDLSIIDPRGSVLHKRRVLGHRGFNRIEWDLLDAKGQKIAASSYTVRLLMGKMKLEKAVLVE